MAECTILASGSGSNFQRIVEALAQTSHRVIGLITDRPGVYALERARALGITASVVPYSSGRAAAESLLLKTLESQGPDIIVLAGFMKVLPPEIVARFPERIVNIHPSLLPRFPGTHAIRRGYEAGEQTYGVTIHLIDEGVDTGPVIQQESIPAIPGETLGQLEERIHALEHLLYPKVVIDLLDQAEKRTVKATAGVSK